FEKIAGAEPPLRAQFLRVIANELDRIQSHLLANSTYFNTIEHETLFMYMLSMRELIMDAIELLAGNRVHMAWNVVGGVRLDVKEVHLKSILDLLDKFESQYAKYPQMFEHGPLLGLRSRDVGVISKEDSLKARTVGPIGRASSIKVDWRTDKPVYKDHLDFNVVWRDEGDNFARNMNRFDEVTESLRLIRLAIENLPEGKVRKKIDIPAGYADNRNEAPRGEVAYMIETNGNLIKNISIRTPSIMNIDACARYMLKDVATVADAVATYASVDPCVACTERVTVINEESGKVTEFDGIQNVNSIKLK
ncbi:MAG: hypothetical protein ABFD07_16055, partial [Methanobacterium sp.]